MDKLQLLKKIEEIYHSGGNIIQYLRDADGRDYNTIEDILISYDFQSGSYIKAFHRNKEFLNQYCSSLAEVIKNLGQFNSIMEAGVGEATTLATLLKYISAPEQIFGFDISWSRLKFAKGFINDSKINNVKLFCANLFEIPLSDNSIDIVYTSHTIEPNGGMEDKALKELYRVTNRYLILLEPAYEFASQEGKQRMKHHGYITNLHSTAVELGYNIVIHRLFDYYSNPLNPTGLILIEKNSAPAAKTELVCPVSKSELKDCGSVLYSSGSLLAYPVIQEIPCLLRENAIIATHFQTDYNQFKIINRIE